jgi:hypothetical protein
MRSKDGARLIACAMAALPTLAHGGAWPLSDFKTIDIQSVEATVSDRDDRRFRQIAFRNYGELGLPGPFTLGGQLSHVEQRFEQPGFVDNASGVADAELFLLTHRQIGETGAAALKLRGRFATSKTAGFTRLMGEDASVGASFLRGINLQCGFLQAEAGYLRSLGEDADRANLDLTWGQRFGPMTLLVQSFSTKSLLPKSEGGLDFDRHQLRASLLVPLRKKLRLELGGRADIATRGFDESRGAFLSLWWTT